MVDEGMADEQVAGIRQSVVRLPEGTVESRRVLIFANPIAGRGKGARVAEGIRKALSGAGYEGECVFERADLAELPDGPVHAAVSIGGDGTLRGVVARLAERERLRLGADKTAPSLPPPAPAPPPPPVLVVPAGTANLMRRNLGIDWNAESIGGRVVEAVRAYRLAARDAALANGKLFLIVAGAGLDGQIIHELERRRTGPINYLSYALPSALSIKAWKYHPITVEVDGKVVFGPMPGMCMVGNIKEHGIGFSFLARAVPDDGLLDVLAFPCGTMLEGFLRLYRAARGQLVESEGAVYLTGKRCRITASEEIPVQVDGEAAGFTPLEVEMAGFQVPFIVTGTGSSTSMPSKIDIAYRLEKTGKSESQQG